MDRKQGRAVNLGRGSFRFCTARCALALIALAIGIAAVRPSHAEVLAIAVPAGYQYGNGPTSQLVTAHPGKGYVSPRSAADPTDPVIVAKATALSHDPAQIFAFVRDQIAIDPYQGSLRGAHGTLAGMAGNSLDRSSLAIALLRASGFTARYAQGALAYADAQTLVARAFANPQRMVGCNNPGARFDGANDFTLDSDMLPHFWIEYQAVAAGPWIALDSAFAGATSGQTFTAKTCNFDDVPENLQNKMRIRVTAETFSQAGAVYGFGLSTTTMLDQTFDTVDLVDKPVTVGHFVSRSAPPSLAIGATINTYSPYVTVGNSATAIDNYQIVRGADYSETFTNFPLGTTLVTGVFVDIDVISSSNPGNPQNYRRVLVDRIGYATRQNGGSVTAPQPTDPPALTALDLLTIQASPSQQPLDAFATRQTRLTALRSQLAPLVSQVNALPPPSQQTPDQVALRTQANNLNRDTTIALLELMTSAYAGYADHSVQDIGATFLVKAWIAAPRLTIAHSSVDNAGFHLNLDIRRNDLRVWPLTGISFTNATLFERARGIAESMLEGQVFTAVTGMPSRNIGSIFTGAPADLVAITRFDPASVDQLSLSADAKARIRDTVANNGRTVLAPRAPVTVNGSPYSVWLETDPNSGYTISSGEDGTHQAIGEYGGLLLDLFGVDSLETQMAKFIGQVDSLGVSGIAFTAAVLDAISSGDQFTNLATQIKQILNSATGPLQQMMDFLEKSGASKYCEGGCGLIQNMTSGLLDGIKAFKDAIGAGDPPVPSILLSPPQPPLPDPIAPGTSPGFTMSVARDTRYFVPYNGAEVPSVYLAKITNTGPATDTFRIDNVGVDAPYSMTPAVGQITLAAGASGEFGVCLSPYAALPPTGTNTGFHLHVYSTKNPGADHTFDGSQSTAASSALLLDIQPSNVSAHAGDSIPATLTLHSLGNTATNVSLSSLLPTGLTIGGVPPSVALAIGETRSLAVTATIGAGVSSGSSLAAQINGAFGASAPASAFFTANVTSTLTTCVASAAIDANAIGRDGLSATLVRLAGAMDTLAGNPTSADDRFAVLSELDDLTNAQFNAGYLTSYVAPVSAERSALASAATGGVNAVLATINTTLCGLHATLQAAATDDIVLGLVPTQSIAIPTQPVTVHVNLYNSENVPRIFDVAVSGQPAQVTAVLSSATVTVPALTQTNGCCAPALTITFTNTDNQARSFDYVITATPHDNPTVSQHATGNFVLRSDIVRVASVNATPIDADAGTPITVSVKLMNSLNAARNVFLFWTVRDGTNTPRRSGQSDGVTLAPGDGIKNIPDFSVDTTGFDGAYTIEVDVVDQSACCATLPGGTGFGSFLIGQPFSALLTATPSTVPIGNSAINYALALSHESAPTPVIDPRASLTMPASTRSFVRNGNYLYVCQADRISIVDTQNPSVPTIAATFATDLLGIGYAIVGCNLDVNTLVLAYNLQSPTSFDNLKIVAFDIGGAHAISPVQLNATPVEVPKRFGGGIAFNGTHQGSLVTSAVIYNPFSGFIGAQFGNLITLDFSTPTAPVQTGELFHHFPDPTTDTNDPIYGGPNFINSALPRGNYTLLASTSATGDGFGTGPGVGRIVSVDTTQLPTNCPGSPNPCIVKTTDIPEARILGGMTAQGNAGLVAGDTQGAYDGYSGYTGQLTLSALDLTSATNPIVKSTLVSLMLNRRPSGAPCNQPADIGGSTLNPLTNNYYAVGAFNPLSCSWVLAIVDANDTANLRIIPYDVPSVLRQTILNGDKLYALTDTAILVYDYATLAGPAITAYVDIPKGNGVSVTPASFSVAPTSVDTSASDHDRYTWYRPTATNITWMGQVTGMVPGEIRNVAIGGKVTYTLPTIGSGALALNAVNVSSGQTMSISPTPQSVALGDSVSYTVTITNPTSSAVNYALTLGGVPAGWLKHLDTPISVPANGQATSTLVLQTTLADPQYTAYSFTVFGAASTGFKTSASALLNTQGLDVGGNSANAVNASSLTPLTNTVSVGRGDVATMSLRVANLGTAAQNDSVFTVSTPSGISVFNYSPNGFTINAGATIDVSTTVSAISSMTPGTYPVTVQLNSYAPVLTAMFNVAVLGQGVTVELTPSSGIASTPFTARIINRGTATDTFDISALGPLGPAVTISPSSVTLDADTSMTVAVTLVNADFLPQGTSTFDIQAVSRAQSAARGRVTGQITSDARKGIALLGEPQSIAVPSVPSTRSFGVSVKNAGNIEDAYSLAITAKSANVSASLRNSGGGAVQSLAPIRLPGNALALANVDATLNSGTSGTITLTATSQSDASVTATTVLSIAQNGSPNIVLGTPGSLDFGDQALTTTSDVHSIVLTNSGLGGFTIGAIALDGANPGDFTRTTGSNGCVVGATIAASGGTCTLYVTFTPAALGSRDANIDVSNVGATATISVPLHGNGVDVSGHLSAQILPGRDYVQFGHTLNYLISARNPSATATTGVSISSTLPSQVDAAFATWLCINVQDSSVTCTANGNGPLSDTGMRVPANGSVNYLLSVPVKPQTVGEQIVSTATVTSIADPGPYSATSTPTQIVLYRDGFQPYGDGASSSQPPIIDGNQGDLSNAFSFDSSNNLLLDLSATPAVNLIDTLIVAHAKDGTGFRVERLTFDDHAWVRAVAFDALGAELCGSWISVSPAGSVTIAIVDAAGASTLLLQVDAGDSTSITLKGSVGQSYSVQSAGIVQVLTP
jgi:large repetitive protein